MANTPGRKKRAVQPLRSSPLFAPAVALWFAALFGLGTLAAGTTAIERVVLALHIDSLIPPAAPPLGMTARILVAGGMTVLGAAIGFALAWIAAAPVRRHTAAKAAAAAAAAAPVIDSSAAFEPEMPAFRARDLHPDAPVRAPMAAHEELGEPLLDDVEPQPGTLATLVDFGDDAEPDAEAALLPSLAELVELPGEPVEVDVEHFADAPAFADVLAEAESHAQPEVDPEPEIEAQRVAERVLPPLPAAARRIAEADLEDLSNLELVERLAIAMQRRAAAEGLADEPFVAFPAREDSVVAPLTPVLRSLAEQRPGDTEKALRDALATLQRMSGAA